MFEIADGSAIPQLEWCRSSPQKSMFHDRDEIDEVVEAAYAAVIAVFEGSDGEAPSLGSEKLRALNRFGPGAKDDERIKVTARDGSGKAVSLDMHRRKKLITGARDTYRSRPGHGAGSNGPRLAPLYQAPTRGWRRARRSPIFIASFTPRFGLVG